MYQYFAVWFEGPDYWILENDKGEILRASKQYETMRKHINRAHDEGEQYSLFSSEIAKVKRPRNIYRKTKSESVEVHSG